MTFTNVVLIAFTALCGVAGVGFALFVRWQRKKAARFYEMAEDHLLKHEILPARQALHHALRIWCLDGEGRRRQEKQDAALLQKILAKLLTIEAESRADYAAVLQASHAADKLAELLDAKSLLYGYGREWPACYQAFLDAKAKVLSN